MAWDPDDEHGNVDESDDGCSTPLEHSKPFARMVVKLLLTLTLRMSRRSSTTTAIRLMMICIKS